MNFTSELKTAFKKRSLIAIATMCFFWSVSSLMVFSILPVFMTEELGITPLELGWIEGIAVSLAFGAKILSGVFSDYIKQRRILLVIGTATSLILKSLFALATNGFSIFIARSMDRLAKGVRSAPVDALIADLYPKKIHGISYGLRQFFYIMGSVVGSLIAAILLRVYNDYRLVFWCSLIPVFFALIIVVFFVHDASHHLHGKARKFEWNKQDLKNLPPSFWHIIMVSSVLMLTRFSDSFLSLKAREIGVSVAVLPFLLMGYELMHAVMSLPVGWLADHMPRKKILMVGVVVLMLANTVMIYATSPNLVLLGYLMAGMYMGVTQSLMSTLIAENTSPHLRGSAFSIYYFTTGVSILIANLLAGYLSDRYQSASAPFYGGLFFSVIACIMLIALVRKVKE